jgi:hypothetical protein
VLPCSVEFFNFFSNFSDIYTTHTSTNYDLNFFQISQIFVEHINKPRLVSKMIFFDFLIFFKELQNEGGRKPRRPPRQRTGLILLYIIKALLVKQQ